MSALGQQIPSFPSSSIPSGERRGLSTCSTPGRNGYESYWRASGLKVSRIYVEERICWCATNEEDCGPNKRASAHCRSSSCDSCNCSLLFPRSYHPCQLCLHLVP